MGKLKKISKVLAIDFETANRKRSSACSLGFCVIDFDSGEIVEKRHFLINPQSDFEYFNSLINGITADMVKDAPIFAEVLPEITSRIDDNTVVVAHNASFDMSVLRRSCEEAAISVPDLNFFCTYQLARALLPGMASYKLTDVAEACGIPSFRHHIADDDAEACAFIFLHFIKEFEAVTIEQLSRRSGVRYGYIYNSHYRACHKTCEPKKELNAQTDDDSIFEISENDVSDETSPFSGKVVVFTGALAGLPRSVAEQIVESMGGIVKNNVSKNTNFIICGYQDPTVLKGKEKSSKHLKAEELAAKGFDIQIVMEDDFFKMI